MQYRAFIFDDTHTPQGDFPVYVLGRNDVDLGSQIQTQNSAIINGLPPLWTAEFQYTDAITIYFLLDQASFMVIAQAFVSSFVADAVANQPPFFPMLVNPKKSPRYTGFTDAAGVKVEPPPSDKSSKGGAGGDKLDFTGAPGLVEAFLGLAAYESVLRETGRLRDAGIVQFAIDQVNNNVWSITEAFAYLREQRLV